MTIELVAPQMSGKTTMTDLSGVEVLPYLGHADVEVPKIYHFDEGGFRFDFLWWPKADTDKLFILFSGDARREKWKVPVFQRWKSAQLFPGHCLYISDPALRLHDRLGLAWYVGTENFDPFPTLARLIQGITAQLSISLKNVVTYGSSGGGFAALRFLKFLPSISAVAINPQISIRDYHESKVLRFLDVCFPGRTIEQASDEFSDRLDILSSIDSLKDRHIVYVQNRLDEFHLDFHFKRFCGAVDIRCDKGSRKGDIKTILFSHRGGHKKAETAGAFERIMSHLSAYKSSVS